MWTVVLVLLWMGPTGEMKQNTYKPMKDVAECLETVEHLLSKFPDPHDSYYIGCLVKPTLSVKDPVE